MNKWSNNFEYKPNRVDSTTCLVGWHSTTRCCLGRRSTLAWTCALGVALVVVVVVAVCVSGGGVGGAASCRRCGRLRRCRLLVLV